MSPASRPAPAGAPARRRRRPAPTCLIALLFAATAPLAGQECPQGRISHVFVDNHSIFDPETLPEDARIRWAYEFANRVHVRTREDFIRDEILLREGDCFDPGMAQESGRILRDFRFIANADVYDVPQPDGTRHLVVDTRDEWSTKLTIAPGYDEGLKLEGAAITEENFLGRGMLVSAFYRERRVARDAGVLIEAPRVLSGPWDGLFELVRTRIGTSFEQLAIRPFVGEEPQLAIRQRIRRRDRLFTYQAGELSEHALVILPVMEDLAEMTVAARFGHPGGLYVVGGGLSWEAVRFTGGLGAPEVIPHGGDYGSREAAPSSVTAAVAPHLVERKTGRLNLLGGVRRLHFQERRGLDAIRGVQDVPFGTEAMFAAGRSVGFLPRTSSPEARDLLLRGEVFWGRPLGGDVMVHALVRGEGRLLQDDGDGNRAWRDVLLQTTALAYWQPGPGSRQVWVSRVSTAGGWHATGPLQVSLGGEDGVRGFREQRFPGARSAVVSLENRIAFDRPLRGFADLGLSTFADGGFVWPGDVPFGVRSGFQSSVGLGLRVGFPAGSSSVVRLDLAVPVTGDDSFRSPVLRVSAGEILGLLAPLGSRMLDRSRRSGVETDFTGVAVEPYRW